MSPSQSTIFRLLLAAGCLLAAWASFATFRDGKRQRVALVEILRQAGFEDSGSTVIQRVENERTTHHAQLDVARTLVYAVLDFEREAPEPIASAVPGSGAAPPAAEPAAPLVIGTAEWDAAVERLDTAADLARRALSAQPNSWQAAMLLGAAVYLQRSIRRDRSLYTKHEDWEVPLDHAVRQAPGQPEPRRFLAAAYLETWPALSPEKKQRTRELLTAAFAQDRQAFTGLLPVWLGVAGDLESALAVIPDRSAAWQELERIYADRRDWEAFCKVHVQRFKALRLELQENLEQAELRLTLGELFQSRSLLLQVISRSPLDVRFAPLVTRALELYPPGLHNLKSTDPLIAWLLWALELQELGRNPLPARVVGRLAGAAGNLAPWEAGRAALVGGELYHAEQLELQVDTLALESWGPYLLAKIRLFLDREKAGEAAEALSLVTGSARRSLAYALLRVEVASARRDLVELAAAEKELDGLRMKQWSAALWQWQGRRAVLRILPATAARGLTIVLARVSSQGAVVEIRWDGGLHALQPVSAEGEIEVTVPVTAEPHFLELRMVAGQQVFPGEVRLIE